MARLREDEVDGGLSRREVLKVAGVVALGAAAAAALDACAVEPGAAPPVPTEPPPSPFPTAANTPTPWPTATMAPAVTPTPVPFTPTPRPASTPTPRPTSTATPRPSPTPTPTPRPVDPERARISYLLRRAGFGASQAELDKFQAMGLTATIDYLLDYEKVDDSALESRIEAQALDLTKIQDVQRWWFLRMVYTARPLQEKMVLFWHGLLANEISKVGRADRMWRQNQLFREQALGNFATMLKAISRDPSMLVYLDSQSNKKTAPNENFARELMELFSMGVGNYTETDVRESARAFTGWSLNNNGFFFNARDHDYGQKTFLGRTGGWDGDDIVDIIVQQPAAANYICRRLFKFFAYDEPEPEVLAGLASVFQHGGGSIKAVVREILMSGAFYSQKAYRSHPKSPVELVASSLRTLGLETDGRGLSIITSRMGQTPFDPPNVAGWPGGSLWINSSTLLERLNWANRLSTERSRFLPKAQLQAAGLAPKDAVDFYSALLIDGAMPAEERIALDKFAQTALKGSDEDAALRAIVFLVLASPDYQLA